MHVKSESRHFVKLEKSSNIDNTTCVLGLGFVFFVFVCDFFFSFLVHYQMTMQLWRR